MLTFLCRARVGIASNERRPKLQKRSSDEEDAFVREGDNPLEVGRKGKSAQKTQRQKTRKKLSNAFEEVTNSQPISYASIPATKCALR